MGKALETIKEWVLSTGIKVVIAIVLLIVAFKVINTVCNKLEKTLTKKLDKTITKTLLNVARIIGKIVVVMCLVGYLGIDTSGIAAVITSLGVCVGLAVNGALSNLAGGVLLLLTRPFKIGDYIQAQGYEGTVEDISIISTKIVTVDNKVIFIPNGALSSGSIMNYSDKEVRRVDLNFSVAGNDPEVVKQAILDACDMDEKVLKNPATFVKVTEYGAGNGTKVTVRAWTKTGDYWDTYFELLNNIRIKFEEKKIVIPFNQLDVHIKNN